MSAYGVVYVATNAATGEQYVGQTTQLPRVRFYAHKIAARSPRTKFHAAVAAHGYDVFSFEVVASALTRDGLNTAEKEVIAAYKPTYNATVGGAGRPRTVSDEERSRMSERAKRRWADPERRAATIATIRAVAGTGAFSESGRKGGFTGAGARARWAGHTKAVKVPKDRSASMAASWCNPEVREKRVLGLRAANKRPEVIARRSAATRGREMPEESVAASAKAKWRPVYCPELQLTFPSRKAAAEYIGVGKTAVSEALRHNRKLAGAYTLQEVGHRL